MSENYSKYEDAAWNEALEIAAAKCVSLGEQAEFSYAEELLKLAAREIRSMKRH